MFCLILCLLTTNSSNYFSARQGAVCHSSCDASQGCWGPRREDCVRCRNRAIDNRICVDSCSELPGYYTPNEVSTRSNPLKGAVSRSSADSNPLSRRLSRARLAAGGSMLSVLGPVRGMLRRHLEPLVKLKADRTCSPCHEECANGSCSGPGPDQCEAGCKHAKVGRKQFYLNGFVHLSNVLV